MLQAAWERSHVWLEGTIPSISLQHSIALMAGKFSVRNGVVKCTTLNVFHFNVKKTAILLELKIVNNIEEWKTN